MKKILLIISISILISQDTTYISIPDAFINHWYYNSEVDVNQGCNGCMCPTGEPMFETQIVSYPDWLDTTYVSFFPDTSNYDYYYFGGSYKLIVTGTPLVADIGNTNLILHEYISYDLWDIDYENATWDFTDVYIIDLNVSENYLNGDINNDGIINILDIVQIIDMILNNEYSIVADVNEDGSVDVLDVVLMVNILVGGLPQSN